MQNLLGFKLRTLIVLTHNLQYILKSLTHLRIAIQYWRRLANCTLHGSILRFSFKKKQPETFMYYNPFNDISKKISYK